MAALTIVANTPSEDTRVDPSLEDGLVTIDSNPC